MEKQRCLNHDFKDIIYQRTTFGYRVQKFEGLPSVLNRGSDFLFVTNYIYIDERGT